jgi:hypothetical protein
VYDPHQLLAMIDAHVAGILALCGVAMICNIVYFTETARVARRQRLYSMPPACTFLWLPHDAWFVAGYDTWFNGYGHWYVELFWVALVLTVAFEVLFLVQAIRYGRGELLPSWSPRGFAALICAGAVAGAVVWGMVKHVLRDDLYAVSFGFTMALYPPFGVALLVRRRSGAGQSRLQWAAYTVMAAAWFSASAIFFGPAFRSWQWIALGLASVLGGLAVLYALGRVPVSDPEPAKSA